MNKLYKETQVISIKKYTKYTYSQYIIMLTGMELMHYIQLRMTKCTSKITGLFISK